MNIVFFFWHPVSVAKKVVADHVHTQENNLATNPQSNCKSRIICRSKETVLHDTCGAVFFLNCLIYRAFRRSFSQMRKSALCHHKSLIFRRFPPFSHFLTSDALVQDAPKRGIPMGCHDFFALSSTERNIPNGMLSWYAFKVISL